MATAIEIDDNKCASLQKNINPFTKQPYSEKYLQDLKKRKRLPVYNFQQIFMDLLEEKQNKCIIVTGSGSGKSTQIPQWCLEYSRKINNTKSIVCTQPQKGAAIELAKRVASEIDVKLGTIVGYNVQFDRIYDETTKLIFMTPGVLLHEVISNIKIDKYHIIIIDEAHERQINIDMLISLVYYSLKNTDDLKIIIMGTTLDAAKFQNFFDKSPLLSIPGFTYPIEIIYDNECTVDEQYASQNGIHEILEKIAVLVVQIHSKNTNGDILVFLPGKEDILNTEKYIERKLKQTSPLTELSIIHLHGQLSKSNQDKALKKRKERRVILATNIAESLTIDNIMFVIDSGYIEKSYYNYKEQIYELPMIKISKACANQRKGHTGRVCKGTCYRIYSENDYNNMLDNRESEMIFENLESMFLQLKTIGNVDLILFGFVDPVPSRKLLSTLENLIHYGCLEYNQQITKLGRIIQKFPIKPCLAKILFESYHYNCTDSIFKIVSMLESPSVFIIPNKELTEKCANAINQFIIDDNDFLTLLNIFEGYKNSKKKDQWCKENFLNEISLKYASNTYDQLIQIAKKLNLAENIEFKFTKDSEINIKKVLVSGFFMQAAKHIDNSDEYNTILSLNEKSMNLDRRNSSINSKAEWIIYYKCTKIKSKYVLSTVTSIEPKWLLEMAPNYYKNLLSKKKIKEEANIMIEELQMLQTQIQNVL